MDSLKFRALRPYWIAAAFACLNICDKYQNIIEATVE